MLFKWKQEPVKTPRHCEARSNPLDNQVDELAEIALPGFARRAMTKLIKRQFGIKNAWQVLIIELNFRQVFVNKTDGHTSFAYC